MQKSFYEQCCVFHFTHNSMHICCIFEHSRFWSCPGWLLHWVKQLRSYAAPLAKCLKVRHDHFPTVTDLLIIIIPPFYYVTCDLSKVSFDRSINKLRTFSSVQKTIGWRRLPFELSTLTNVRFGAARVVFLVTLRRNSQDVPLDARIVFPEVYSNFHIITVVFLVYMLQVDLKWTEKCNGCLRT
jgi:hypothetical protein